MVLYVCTFWSTALKPREAHTGRRVQHRIGTAHEANRAHVADGGAGFHAGPRQW